MVPRLVYDDASMMSFIPSSVLQSDISQNVSQNRSGRGPRDSGMFSEMFHPRMASLPSSAADYYTKIYQSNNVSLELTEHFGPKNFRETESTFFFIMPPDNVSWFAKTPLDAQTSPSECQWLFNHPSAYHFEECCSNVHEFPRSTVVTMSDEITEWLHQTEQPICVFDSLRHLTYGAFISFNLAFFLFFVSFMIYYRLSDTLGPLVIAIIAVGNEVLGFMSILLVFLATG